MPGTLPLRTLGLQSWFSYAEWLATNLLDIGHTEQERHYARMAFPELQGIAQLQLHYPALLADTPEAEGVDNSSNNLLVRRYLSWTVVKTVEPGNWQALVDAEDECERIALQVLARMRKDRIHLGGQVFGDVDMNGWQGDTVSPFAGVGFAAYRIMVPVLNQEDRLVYNAARWIGGTPPPTFPDLTGLSCQQLNAPATGLTTQQRLQCILPGYDFSQPATLQALTSQQAQQLTDAFGGTVTTTVNGVASQTAAITVVREGVQVGTLNPATGEHTVPPCPVQQVCPVQVQVRNTNDDLVDGITVADPCVLTGPVVLAAPDATVQRKDSAGNDIGTPIALRSGATNVPVTAPDGTVRTTDGLTTVTTVRSNGTVDLPQSVIKYRDAANAPQVAAASNTEFEAGTLRPATEVPRFTVTRPDGSTTHRDITAPTYTEQAELYAAFRAGDALSAEFTVPASYVGTYTTVAADAGSGATVWQRWNGTAWATLATPFTLATNDLVRAQRTVTTNAGWATATTAA